MARQSDETNEARDDGFSLDDHDALVNLFASLETVRASDELKASTLKAIADLDGERAAEAAAGSTDAASSDSEAEPESRKKPAGKHGWRSRFQAMRVAGIAALLAEDPLNNKSYDQAIDEAFALLEADHPDASLEIAVRADDPSQKDQLERDAAERLEQHGQHWENGFDTASSVEQRQDGQADPCVDGTNAAQAPDMQAEGAESPRAFAGEGANDPVADAAPAADGLAASDGPAAGTPAADAAPAADGLPDGEISSSPQGPEAPGGYGPRT